jgi:hypothetical protein
MANRNVMEPFQENVIDGMSGMVQQVAAVLYRNYANAIGYSFLLGRFMQ